MAYGSTCKAVLVVERESSLGSFVSVLLTLIADVSLSHNNTSHPPPVATVAQTVLKKPGAFYWTLEKPCLSAC